MRLSPNTTRHSNFLIFSEISSGSIGSDYFSQVSPRSFSSVGSDHDHERDHGELSAGGDHNSDDTSPSGNSDNDSGHHSLLSATKSYNHPSTNSCSFFRSPKLDIKVNILNRFQILDSSYFCISFYIKKKTKVPP